MRIQTNHRWLLFVLRNISLLLFVFIFVAFSLFNERFASLRNFENIILASADVGIVAIGMTFVLLTGGIDLSVGATMYITGAVVALMLEDGWGLAASIPCGIFGRNAVGLFQRTPD